jgi:enoyl-CoA hydratase
MNLAATAMLVACDGHVATVTFNRPDLLNRLDAIAHDELIACLEQFGETQDLRCIILASTGKAFSAGGDLQEIFTLHDDADKRAAMFAQGRRLVAALLDLTVPVVVAMQGDAHGLGANIALLCDAVVACKTARLSDAHVRVGLAAGDGGCVAWPQALGMLRAKRHLLTGDMLTAEQAFALGAVTDLVELPEDVLPAARKLAEKIAGLPPLAVQRTKQALNAVVKQRAAEVFELALALEAETMASDDVLEATRAFLEKRLPVFTGT